MNRILLIEDSRDCQLMVKHTFPTGTEVEIAATLQEARTRLGLQAFHLILLDMNLPDGDGIEFFGELKTDPKFTDVPVLFITSESEVTRKVTAFSMGAEDYIQKPFHPLELRARVEAKLKKLANESGTKSVITKGNLQLDASGQRAYVIEGETKRPVQFTSREFHLLFHLCKHEQEILSRDQLLSAVWGDDVTVSDRTVDTHIYAIRKKLGAPIAAQIESVPGSGYRFVPAAAARRKAA